MSTAQEPTCVLCGQPADPRLRSAAPAADFCSEEHRDQWHRQQGAEQKAADGEPLLEQDFTLLRERQQ